MLTVKSEPRRIAPAVTQRTEWAKHPFFEGSSIRKISETYYFIYSSWKNHELCYATSRFPDRDFRFRGTIVSNGDVGYLGRKDKDRLNATGNTHGSIEEIRGQWYVFYHRQTHRSDYSRQACAEPIAIAPDGSIAQVEITSCGLNGAPLRAEGTYPASICCNLTNGHMPHGCNKVQKKPIPCVSSEGDERFIRDVENNTWIGYKYFDFTGSARLSVTLRGGSGVLEVSTVLNGAVLASVPVSAEKSWHKVSVSVPFPQGRAALYLRYVGKEKIDILDFTLSKEISR